MLIKKFINGLISGQESGIVSVNVFVPLDLRSKNTSCTRLFEPLYKMA
jgi:hypothetical protein